MLSKYTQARIRKIEITYALTHPEMMTTLGKFISLVFIFEVPVTILMRLPSAGDNGSCRVGLVQQFVSNLTISGT